MVSLQGHALISACDISNVSYGIRCIQNARVSGCLCGGSQEIRQGGKEGWGFVKVGGGGRLVGHS